MALLRAVDSLLKQTAFNTAANPDAGSRTVALAWLRYRAFSAHRERYALWQEV